MRKIFPLVLLSFGSFAASEETFHSRYGSNLKGITVCISDHFIRSSDTIGDDTNRTYSKSNYQIIKSRLTAYRIPFSETCSASYAERRAEIYVNLSMTGGIGTQGARSYSVDFSLYVKGIPSYIDGVDIYSDLRSGNTINYSNAEMRDLLTQRLKDAIDAFAEAYAKANP